MNMKEQLMLVRLDTEYCDYLRKFDDKVPYNYNEKELRPFVGVLFRIDKLMYFAPLSSPKPKHHNPSPLGKNHQPFKDTDGFYVLECFL